MTSAAEAAKIIRNALKALGISSRKVSVRAENYSMGSSVHVWIKDPTVKLATVRAIAQEQERIDRCPITGDILSGCNRFIHIGYSGEANQKRAEPYLEACRQAGRLLDDLPPGHLIRIKGTQVSMSSDHGRGYQLWNDGKEGMHINTPECAARYVADYVDRAEA